MAIHIRNEELPGSSISRTFLGTHAEAGVVFVQASPPARSRTASPTPRCSSCTRDRGRSWPGRRRSTLRGRARAGGEVHGFTASGDGPLRMTCIHTNHEMITEWVEPR